MKGFLSTLAAIVVVALAYETVSSVVDSSGAPPTGKPISADALSTAEIEERLATIMKDDRPETTSISFQSGVITIERQLDACETGVGQRRRYIVIDVRALRSGRNAYTIRPFTPAEGTPGVFVLVEFRSEVAVALEAARRTAEAHIDRARAEYGWGHKAAAAVSKIVMEQHADTVALYHIRDVYCDGIESFFVTDGGYWPVAILTRTENAEELISLLRAYQVRFGDA